MLREKWHIVQSDGLLPYVVRPTVDGTLWTNDPNKFVI